jgi:hypothetical protein
MRAVRQSEWESVMADGIQQQELTVLLTEYERVYSEIMDMQRKADTLFGFGVTGVGAGVLYGLKQEVPGILAVVTLFGAALVLYIVLCYCVIMSLGGYKHFLESTINLQTNSEWLRWERSITKPFLHGAWEMKLVFVVMLLLPITTFILSFTHGGISNDWIRWTYIGGFAVVYSASLSSARRLTTLPEQVREAANKGRERLEETRLADLTVQ